MEEDIITSLDFIKDGIKFPPESSKSRIKKYNLHLKHYKGTYNRDRKLVVVTREGLRTYDNKVLVDNYFRLITNKFIGLVFTEKPLVKLSDKDKEDFLRDMIEGRNVWYKTQQVAKSFSKLGDGYFFVYDDEGTGGGNVNWLNPVIVYVIVSPSDITNITGYVLAQPIFETETVGVEQIQRHKYMRFIIHRKGYYAEIVKEYNDHTKVIGSAIEYRSKDFGVIPVEGRVTPTGLSDFAVQGVHNNLSIDAVYGISDYDAIQDIVYELEKRITLGSIVIDKNIESILIVPANMIRTNELTGKVEFKGEGGIISAPPNSTVDPKYVAPDGKTEANEKLIGILIDEMVRQSEYGKVFFFGEYSNASGEALKTMLKGALDKVSRQIDSMDHTIKKVLCLMAEYSGVYISPHEITIQWQDGIAESLKTVTDAIKSRKESGTLSTKSILMRFDNLNGEQADEELTQLQLEQSMVTVATVPTAPTAPTDPTVPTKDTTPQDTASFMSKVKSFFGL